MNSADVLELAERLAQNPQNASEVIAKVERGEVSLEELATEIITPPFMTLGQVGQYFGDIVWEWPGYIPSGHLTLIVGETGVGKSYLTCAIIAAHLGLRPYPDGFAKKVPGRRVLLLETEEMRGVYYERLRAMGVPDDAVILPGEDPTYMPDILRDYQSIEHLAASAEATLLVVDSLSGGHGIDENNSQVREVLQILAGMASRLKVPFLCNHHLRKRNAFEDVAVTLDRVRGSSTITQFARSVIGLYKPNPESDTIRADVIKASFCKPPKSFGLVITDNGVAFTEPPEKPRQETALDRATEFLRAKLRDRPVRSAELLKQAEAEGISKNTLYRAKEKLGIVSVDGKWGLPYKECPHRNWEFGN